MRSINANMSVRYTVKLLLDFLGGGLLTQRIVEVRQ